MYILKAGEGCVMKMRLVEANGAPIELRNARFVQAILHLPNEATMLCEDVRFDEVSQHVFVRLSAIDELTMEGVYGININALFDGRVVTSAVLDFAEVKANTESRYFELLIDLFVSTTDVPSCVKYTGASPKISENGTWLVFNDEINAFEDTGISIFGKSAYQAAIESGNFSGTEEEFNAYMGSIPQITNDAILSTKSANEATINANQAAQDAVSIANSKGEEAISRADEKGNTAIQQAQDAGAEAVRIASEAATQATTAANEADVATEQANNAATNANEAAQRANEEVENLREKANIDGSYPDMTVGKAENLVGRGEATEEEFTFRPSAGKISIEDGSARITTIKGNSVVYNQIIRDSLFQDPTQWNAYNSNTRISFSSGYLQATANASGSLGIQQLNTIIIPKHKYLCICDFEPSVAEFFAVHLGGITSKINVTRAYRHIISLIAESGDTNSRLVFYPILNAVEGNFANVYSFRTIDITIEFGAGNEPTSYEEYLQRKPIGIEDEYAYNKGTLVNMNVDSIISTSNNAFNPVTGLARVIGGVQYLVDDKEGVQLATLFSADGEEFTWISDDGEMEFPADGYVKVEGQDDNYNVFVGLLHSYIKPLSAFQQETKDLSIVRELFPNGMKYIPSQYFVNTDTFVGAKVSDELRYNSVIKKWEKVTKIGSVELSSLEWKYISATDNRPYGLFYANIKGKKGGTYNIFSDAYSCRSYVSDKSIIGLNSGKTVYIRDDSYQDVESLKIALSGKSANYELDTPIVEELDIEFNPDYLIWDFGTEEALSSVPSTPFRADIIYKFNAVDRIRNNTDRIYAAEEELTNVAERISALEDAGGSKDKYWAVCGDSITNANLSPIYDIEEGDAYMPIDGYSNVNTYKRKNYAYYVAKRNGLKWANYGWSNSTLSSVTSKAFGYRNAFVDDRMKELADYTWDYISIFFGGNDATCGPYHHRDKWLQETYGADIGYPSSESQIGTDGFATAEQKAACDAATGEVNGVQYNNSSDYFLAKFIGSIDSTDTSTWYGALNTCVTYLMGKYDKAKIILIASYTPSSPKYADAVVEVAKKYGIRYFDFRDVAHWATASTASSKYINLPNLNDADGKWHREDGTVMNATVYSRQVTQYLYDSKHPNNRGYEEMSYMIEPVIIG